LEKYVIKISSKERLQSVQLRICDIWARNHEVFLGGWKWDVCIWCL